MDKNQVTGRMNEAKGKIKEETGKVFPVSDRATDVLGALLDRLQRSGAELSLEEPVMQLANTESGFLLTTPRRVIQAPKIILTTGGKSYPGSGTTGDGYRLAAQFGHTIVSPVPALVPITVNLPWVAELRGITLPDISLQVIEKDRVLASCRDSLLFAHFGLTGPAPLNVSRVISRHPAPTTLHLQLDILPAESEEQLDEFLRQESAASGRKQLAVVLSERIPRRLCDALMRRAGLLVDRRAAALSRPERTSLVRVIKRLLVPITGTLGFGKAEVTAGGVSLDEVDSRTMQSKRRPGFYLAGEVVDLDGPIGGYNFQAAFSTGWLAGSAAAKE